MKPTYSDSNGNRYTTAQIDAKSDSVAKDLINIQFLELGNYNECQECGINDRHAHISVAHKISRKKAKENGECELCWDMDNMLILCLRCHSKYDRNDIKFTL